MTRSRSRALLAGAALLLIGALAAGCGGGNDSPDATAATPMTAAPLNATLKVSNGSLGKILVDSQGRTLYLFKKDTGTTSMCTGACAANWPPLRANGKQVVYHGHPLYRYSGDRKPGDTNGQGVSAFGARWYALSPAGDQVSGKSSSSGGSSYGY